MKNVPFVQRNMPKGEHTNMCMCIQYVHAHPILISFSLRFDAQTKGMQCALLIVNMR